MVVGIGGGIGTRGRPLYMMWALGWGGKAQGLRTRPAMRENSLLFRR